MTQDELRAALLLMGFRYSNKQKILVYITRGVHFTVHLNTNPKNTAVRFCRTGSKWQQVNTTPEAVFNFIKKRFL